MQNGAEGVVPEGVVGFRGELEDAREAFGREGVDGGPGTGRSEVRWREET